LYSCIEAGKGALQLKKAIINRSCEKFYYSEIAGRIVKTINSSVWKSEIGNILSKDSSDFAAIWSMNRRGFYQISLRSDKHCGEHVGKIAKFFGGGGHRNAASFQSDTPPVPIEVDE